MKKSMKLFKNLKSHQLLMIVALVVGGYFLYTYSKSKAGSLDGYAEINEAGGAASNEYVPSSPHGENSANASVGGMNTNMQGLPPSCVRQNVTDPRELLPRDANSEFSQLNPQGDGDVQNVSFIQAGVLQGINTVGSTLKNPNLQLRSEPPNPRVDVGPWNNSTITHDNNKRDLEIGSNN
jgi:hypothetical protein